VRGTPEQGAGRWQLAAIAACLGLGLSLAPAASGKEFERKLSLGLRAQGWFQWVEGVNGESDLEDFQLRRVYLYVHGALAPKVSYFAHVAVDRLGQEGLDNPSLGLGSGLAIRDGWIALDLAPSCKIQLGRMYVPFTRAFGTEGTFSLLGLDLPFTQGGVRGAIFYPSKVGRDDGVVVWGNLLGGSLQYRAGILDGLDGASNPSSSLRWAGRLGWSLWDKETTWFNQGTYLGKKRVLVLGAGADRQSNLGPTGERDYNAVTFDVFMDQPIGAGAVTLEAALTEVHNAVAPINYTWLESGDEVRLSYLQGGYLLPNSLGPGRLQPYARYERVSVSGKPDTGIASLGCNYLLRGHDLKLTVDWTHLNQRVAPPAPPGHAAIENRSLISIQLSAGF